MKRFSFTLQTVLDVKETLEQQHRDALSAQDTALSALRNRLTEEQSALAEAKAAFIRILSEGTGSIALFTYNSYFRLQDERIKATGRDIAAAELERSRIAQQLVNAMRERKVLENLKEKQYAEYKKEVERENERVIGEHLTNTLSRDES